MNWNGNTRDEQLAELQRNRNFTGSNLIIARMWIYQRDLEYWGHLFADAKTEYGRVYGRAVVQERLKGEKSAEVAGHKAEQLDEVYIAHLNYRKAEQMVTANRAALQILHGELEEWRTQQANARAENQWQARTQP